MFNFQNTRQIEKLVITVLWLLAFLFLFLTLYFAKLFFYGKSAENIPATIAVSASGEVKAIPNIATFSFSVVQSGKDVNEAGNKMSEIANKTVAYLKSKGIDDKDIQTTNYNANPKYEYQEAQQSNGYIPGKQVLVGYEVRETITVKVHDASKAGDILGGVGKFGVTEISSLTFESEDKDELKQQATEDAIKKAEEKAKRLAKAGGFRLVKVTGFYEEGNNSPVPMMYDKAMSVSAPEVNVAPDIQVGENTITSTVTLTYEIR